MKVKSIRTVVAPYKGFLSERFGGYFAQISTVTQLRLRSSIKDVHRIRDGRVTAEIEQICKRLPVPPQGITDHDFVFGYTGADGQQVKGIIETDATLQAYVKLYPEHWAIVQLCLGVPRQNSVHACAVVLTNEPITNFLPTMTVGSCANPVTQYTGPWVEEVGGLKYDFLGVNSLNDIQGAIKLVQQKHSYRPKEEIINGQRVPALRVVPHCEGGRVVLYDVWDLPEDQSVIQDICRGDTATVFQFNTGSARQWLKKFWVDGKGTLTSINDLAAFTALDRPGPLDAFVSDGVDGRRNMLEEYAARAQGLEPYEYDETLGRLFPDTHAILCYQEQLQQTFQVLGQSTPEEADEFRIHVGKKQMAKVAQDREIFMRGAIETLGSEERAAHFWDKICSWASYGFNRCIDGDCRVVTKNRGVQAIKHVMAGDVVTGVDTSGKAIETEVVALHDNGILEGYEVEFDDGATVVCSLEHKFLTQRGMMPLSKIIESDEPILATGAQNNDCEVPPPARLGRPGLECKARCGLVCVSKKARGRHHRECPRCLEIKKKNIHERMLKHNRRPEQRRASSLAATKTSLRPEIMAARALPLKRWRESHPAEFRRTIQKAQAAAKGHSVMEQWMSANITKGWKEGCIRCAGDIVKQVDFVKDNIWIEMDGFGHFFEVKRTKDLRPSRLAATLAQRQWRDAILVAEARRRGDITLIRVCSRCFWGNGRRKMKEEWKQWILNMLQSPIPGVWCLGELYEYAPWVQDGCMILKSPTQVITSLSPTG